MLFFRRFSRWGEVATLAGNSCHRLVGNVVLRKQNRCIADLCTVSFGSSATDCGSVHVAGARASFRKISGEYAVTASLPARTLPQSVAEDPNETVHKSAMHQFCFRRTTFPTRRWHEFPARVATSPQRLNLLKNNI